MSKRKPDENRNRESYCAYDKNGHLGRIPLTFQIFAC